MSIICQGYILQTSIDLIKEKWFLIKKTRNKRYPAETVIDADYTDDLTHLANTLAEAKSLMLSLEKAAGEIDQFT